MRPRRLPALLASLAVVALVGCGGGGRGGGGGDGAAGTITGAGVVGEVVVFAAASLTESFSEVGERFEAEHPGASVTFNFAASSALVQQIAEGAPADVFASADQANMEKLTDAAGNASEPQVFAQNALQIIVPPGNPLGITGLADLARDDVLFVTCAPQVPIGRYSAEALAKAHVDATPASFEENVKSVVTKVALGEADAGIVYATDVTAAGRSGEGVDIPAAHNVVADYPITTVEGAPHAGGADAFMAFVLSPDGQEVLERFGFSIP